jgi:hypothetical protein
MKKILIAIALLFSTSAERPDHRAAARWARQHRRHHAAARVAALLGLGLRFLMRLAKRKQRAVKQWPVIEKILSTMMAGHKPAARGGKDCIQPQSTVNPK